MAFCFLKYGKHKGGVTAEGFKGWIELDEFSFGVGRGVSTSTGAAVNREASVPSVSEVVVKKKLCPASAYLLEEALHGEGTKAEIKLCHSDKNKVQPYLELEFDNSLVSGYSISHEGGRPVESVSINFTKLVYMMHELDAKNESKAKHPAAWDATKGAAKK